MLLSLLTIPPPVFRMKASPLSIERPLTWRARDGEDEVLDDAFPDLGLNLPPSDPSSCGRETVQDGAASR